MKVLVACEYTGVVSKAFREKGHEAWSCDILPSGDRTYYHLQGDVREFLPYEPWDLIIAHPPCTYLAVSGNKHYSNRPDLYEPAAEFAKMFFDYAEKVCVENPVGRLSTLWRKPDQYIQPWQFGHEASKKTGLWLKNLPKLEPTNIVGKGKMQVVKSGKVLPEWYSNNKKLRDRTFEGIAQAMADQWG